ncbi:carboxypeptidase-like regulatory domain-containing protein [Aequorivita sp. F47161]|uniref:Carboxypeptidase-like regulatory domain-containing protein n=1 Tax=Aequorivita vitellina TaxID=2874475 RepID=A0A9X1U306_9FLAO|nr:carboxypeptidase-like regulatory domain-containing protein [Aequorivita vitellina]MCG2420440.1 carboxypeptidase-like regulatory domain-containing protein [Aequorivita vitellina]
MRKTVLILIILISNLTFSQTEKAELKMKTEFRRLTGNLTDDDGQPFPGQNIMIKGTNIGTQTDLDGNFCLIIPKDKKVFIELPFCFDQIFREIEPTDKTIEMQIGKGKRKTKKAWRNYDKIKAELNSELYKIYNSD